MASHDLTSAEVTPETTVSHDTPSPSTLTEDQALALLKRTDLQPEVLEQISKNSSVLKSRKVKLALAQHPRTPRHVSLPMVRHLFTFDLMLVALTPAVAADIKKAADESLINRLETVSTGEKLTLARRGSGAVAAALLHDAEARVVQAALENSRLVESAVLRAIVKAGAPAIFVRAVCDHPKWSLRREVRVALLRNEKTPFGHALEFARGLPLALVKEVLHASRLPKAVKASILQELKKDK